MACASLEGGAVSSMIMGARVPGYPGQYLVINIIKYLGATSGILLLLTLYLVINIIKYLAHAICDAALCEQ